MTMKSPWFGAALLLSAGALVTAGCAASGADDDDLFEEEIVEEEIGQNEEAATECNSGCVLGSASGDLWGQTAHCSYDNLASGHLCTNYGRQFMRAMDVSDYDITGLSSHNACDHPPKDWSAKITKITDSASTLAVGDLIVWDDGAVGGLGHTAVIYSVASPQEAGSAFHVIQENVKCGSAGHAWKQLYYRTSGNRIPGGAGTAFRCLLRRKDKCATVGGKAYTTSGCTAPSAKEKTCGSDHVYNYESSCTHCTPVGATESTTSGCALGYYKDRICSSTHHWGAWSACTK